MIPDLRSVDVQGRDQATGGRWWVKDDLIENSVVLVILTPIHHQGLYYHVFKTPWMCITFCFVSCHTSLRHLDCGQRIISKKMLVFN